jgi:hypothetical protein
MVFILVLPLPAEGRVATIVYAELSFPILYIFLRHTRLQRATPLDDAPFTDHPWK